MLPNKSIIALTLLNISITGCTEMYTQPGVNELDWIPEKISKEQCPNLTGSYTSGENNNDEAKWAFLGKDFPLYPSRSDYLNNKNSPIIINIKSQENGLYLTAKSKTSSINENIHFDESLYGCNEGSIIARYRLPLRTPGESGGCTSLTYGEYQVNKNNEGDLQITRRQRTRCATWGSLKTQPHQNPLNPEPYIFKKIPQ